MYLDNIDNPQAKRYNPIDTKSRISHPLLCCFKKQYYLVLSMITSIISFTMEEDNHG